MPEDSAFSSRLLRVAIAAPGALPFRLLQALGGLAGLGAWLFGTRGAAVCRENIEMCFPALSRDERRRLARKAMVEAGRTIAESSFAWTRGAATCRALIRETAGEADVDAIDGPRVFIIPHLGNWEMINHYLGERYGLTHMYQTFRSGAVESVIQSSRARSGTEFVPATAAGIRAQRKRLGAGGNIGAMPDQEPPVHAGVFASFFGQQSLTSTLVPELCRRSNAVPVLATCLRLQDGSGFRVEMRVLDTPLTAESMNLEIENAIRAHPEQYLWTYKRFRTRPDGEAELYQLRQSAARAYVEKTAIRAAIAITSRLGLRRARRLGAMLGDIVYRLRLRVARDTAVNLEITSRARELIRDSLRESGKTLLETGAVWRARDFQPRIDEPLPGLAGAIVLTPPLGNREAVMQFLSSNNRVVDYYHPNKRTSLDNLIRDHRTASGIALAPQTNAGVQRLIDAIRRGDTVTLCPDQQPRLRGGVFVPFFDAPALTTKALSNLIRETGAHCYIAVAERNRDGFQLSLTPVEVDRDGDDETILSGVNASLETAIDKIPAQYRWSDRRFNIRPPGEHKLY